MKSKSRIITCLSITDKVIKLAQSCLGRFNLEISAARSVPLPGKSEEEIAKGINLLLSAVRQKDLGKFILMIPRQMAALHYARLPSLIPKNFFKWPVFRRQSRFLMIPKK